MAGDRTVKVLYLLGLGRSGTTLVDLLLGELDGFFSVGELQSLWQESLINGRLCGCGLPVSRCKLWQRVLGDPEVGIAPQEVVALQRSLRLHSSSGGRPSPELERYRALLARIYGRIADVAGARVVVDSSKLPAVASLLVDLPGVDPYFLHVVRDPRAVAYSWVRSKPALDRLAAEPMERLPVVRSARLWNRRQRACRRLRRRHPEKSMMVRYEDLTAAPARGIAAVADLVGEPATSGFLDGHTAALTPNHTVSGNPIRLGSGAVEVKEDRRWLDELGPGRRAAVTLLTLPHLIRYGYPLRPDAVSRRRPPSAIGTG